MLENPEVGNKEEEKLNKMLKNIKCKNCETIFIPKNKNQIFCSIRCKRAEYKKKTHYTYKCDYCKKEYSTIWKHRPGNKNFFCSRKCEGLYKKYFTNNTYLIKQCEICGKDIEITLKDRLKQRFCSIECQSKWQSLYLRGENSNLVKFTKTLTKDRVCDNCKKVYRAQIKKPLLYNFCSEKCRQEYILNNEVESKDCNVLGYEAGNKTHPQKEVDNLLTELKIEFHNEYPIGTYLIDNFIADKNICVEVMGTYWHADSRVFSYFNLTKQQNRDVQRDIRKKEYLLSLNYKIIYIWEYDILHNKELCKKILKHFILENNNFDYIHSSNFIEKNNEIILSSEIKQIL